jgi:pimeloyl-ACP methyl ester carboxylesterase
VLVSLLDGRFLAERFGAEPDRVIALHGWGRTRQDWAGALNDVGGLALDQPGFGSAPPPPAAWGSDDYARWLIPLVESHDRPVLVGHSFGGRVVAQLTAMRPDLVGGLLLTGTPLLRAGTRPKAPLAYRALRKAGKLGILPEKQVDAARRKYGSADYRNAEGVMREVLVRTVNEEYSSVLDALARYDGPIELVWGAGDTAAPLSTARQIAERTGGTLTVVDDAAHLLQPSLNAAIDQRLRTLLATGTDA